MNNVITSHRAAARRLFGICATLLGVLLLTGFGWHADDEDDPDRPQRVEHLRILWTNDTHGYFMPIYHAEYEEIDTYERTARREGRVGGYAQIAALVKKLRHEDDIHNSLFLDAGDTFDGSPVAQLTRGEAVIPVLNAMGYDAMVPGNRDFAWTKDDFMHVSGMIKFPIVCANLQHADTGQFVFPRYLIKQLPGLKVALIGITSPLMQPGFTRLGGPTPGGYAIENDISQLAAQIRAEHDPDLVIVMSHFGYNQDRKFASRSTGIDVIVGAHTHHNIYDPAVITSADGARDVLVVQAGSHGKFLGKLDLWVKDKEIKKFKHRLIRITEKKYKPDPEVQALADAAYAPFQAMLDQVVGYTTTLIERRGDTQSTMSNFLADALAEIFGTDVARHFGIRYGASIIPGPVTVGDVWNMVSPNIGDNGVYVLTQTGTQIKAVLNTGLNQEYGTDPYNWPGGDVSRHNTRVKYTYKASAPDNQHLVDLSVTTAAGETVELVKNGVDNPTNLARTFTFVSQTGTPAQRVPDTTAVDEIVKYIQRKGTISPRIDDRTVQLD